LGNNINSNNFLEVLIAGVKVTPRVKYVSKYKGNRRVKKLKMFFEGDGESQPDQWRTIAPDHMFLAAHYLLDQIKKALNKVNVITCV